MISVVCVYNNRETLEEYLLKGLRNQSASYDLQLIDNTHGQFTSASSALNHGGAAAAGKYIMFAHQDILIQSSTWLEDAERMLDSVEMLGVAGVAGKGRHGEVLSVTHGGVPRPAGEVPFSNPVEVQTLDECLVIIPKAVFDRLQFDSATCDGWHLYAVDYCLSVRKTGLRSFVLPLPSHHRSVAYSMSADYYRTLKKLFRKHGRDHPWIYSTVGDYYTALPTVAYRVLAKARAVIRVDVLNK